MIITSLLFQLKDASPKDRKKVGEWHHKKRFKQKFGQNCKACHPDSPDDHKKVDINTQSVRDTFRSGSCGGDKGCHDRAGNLQKPRDHMHRRQREDCVGCHDFPTPDVKRNVVARLMKQNDCFFCHNEDKGISLKKRPGHFHEVKQTCYQCHGLDKPHKVNKARSKKAFSPTACKKCHDPKNPYVNIKGGSDHFHKSKPDSCAPCHDKQTKALNRQAAANKMGGDPCGNCHDPDTIAKRSDHYHQQMKYQELRKLELACYECHKLENPKEMVAQRLAATMTGEECKFCHKEDGSRVQRSEHFHQEAKTCYDCHNINNPKEKVSKQVYTRVERCSNCHRPDGEPILPFDHFHRNKKKEGRLGVCTTCHPKGPPQIDRTAFDNLLKDEGCFVCHEMVYPDSKAIIKRFTSRITKSVIVPEHETCEQGNCHNQIHQNVIRAKKDDDFIFGKHDHHINCKLCHDPENFHNPFKVNRANGMGDMCELNGDADGDHFLDRVDNCPHTPSRDLSDTDKDGIGNACDPDKDGDTVLNEVDNCPLTPNPGQEDSNKNGLGDACEIDGAIDSDGDGIIDEIDNCPQIASTDIADIDEDGLGNPCDDDDDNDGILDVDDNCQMVSNPGQGDGGNVSTAVWIYLGVVWSISVLAGPTAARIYTSKRRANAREIDDETEQAKSELGRMTRIGGRAELAKYTVQLRMGQENIMPNWRPFVEQLEDFMRMLDNPDKRDYREVVRQVGGPMEVVRIMEEGFKAGRTDLSIDDYILRAVNERGTEVLRDERLKAEVATIKLRADADRMRREEREKTRRFERR